MGSVAAFLLCHSTLQYMQNVKPPPMLCMRYLDEVILLHKEEESPFLLELLQEMFKMELEMGAHGSRQLQFLDFEATLHKQAICFKHQWKFPKFGIQPVWPGRISTMSTTQKKGVYIHLGQLTMKASSPQSLAKGSINYMIHHMANVGLPASFRKEVVLKTSQSAEEAKEDKMQEIPLPLILPYNVHNLLAWEICSQLSRYFKCKVRVVLTKRCKLKMQQ